MCNKLTQMLKGSSEVEVIKASYTWTITNFSFMTNQKDKKIKSTIFTMGSKNEFKWRLRMYPNGCEEGSGNHISLFLQLLSPTETEILAKFDFSIIKADGVKYTLASHKIRGYTQWKSYGYHELIDRNQVLDERSGLLLNDSLRIVCEVTLGTGNVTNQSTAQEPERIKTELNLLKDFESLLSSKTFADVTLIAGGQRFEVHKAILSARSPVFAAMFEHDMKEKKQNEVEITDIDKDVLEQLIRFLYTGKAEKLSTVATGLLAAADKYAVEDLKLMCEREIFKNLTIDNAVCTLVIADMHNSGTLKDQAINFMKANAVRLVDNFANLVLNSDLVHNLFS